MAYPEQIGVIGAGSARFSLDLVRDLCLEPRLAGSKVNLFDVNTERLTAITKLSTRYAREMCVDLRFEASPTIEATVTDADFVLNTALAGGRGQMEAERKRIEEEVGIFRSIGVNTPFRQLDLIREIGEKTAKHGKPGATLIQCANPVPEGTTQVHRDTGVQVIGLCEGYVDWRKIAALMGMDVNLARAEVVGINHDVWLTKFEFEGKNAYPLLDEWIDKVSPHFFQIFLQRARNVDYSMTPIAVDLYKKYGLFPIGDTNRAIFPEFWWYHVSAEEKARWYGPTGGFDGNGGAGNNLAWLNSNVETVLKLSEDERASVTEAVPCVHSLWDMVPIMSAIATDTPQEFQVNIPNKGAIAGLPADFVVEGPSKVDGKGAHFERTFDIPQKVMLGAILPRWLLAERVLAATKTRDIGFLWQTLMADHKITSPEQAAQVLQIWLEGDENMANHYAPNPIKPYTVTGVQQYLNAHSK